MISETLAVTNGQWAYILNQPLGQYTLLFRFEDTVGNVRLVGPVNVEVIVLAESVLTVTTGGTGSGLVSSNPAGISCGADCAETCIEGTVVTLTAVPDTGSIFSGWSGACTNTNGDCVVTLTQDQSVSATFTLFNTAHQLYLPVVLR